MLFFGRGWKYLLFLLGRVFWRDDRFVYRSLRVFLGMLFGLVLGDFCSLVFFCFGLFFGIEVVGDVWVIVGLGYCVGWD